MAAVKAYRPETNSLSSGQVLHCPYDYEQTRLIVREMTDELVLDIVGKGLVTDQITLTVGYDIENLTDPDRRRKYHGPIVTDRYGRKVPKHAHGTANLSSPTSSTREIMDAAMELYDRIINPELLSRRLTVTANHLIPEQDVPRQEYEQLDLFTDYEALERERQEAQAARDRERRMQEAVLAIKRKYGKNAIVKGMDLQEGATAMARNAQIGGHKA